MSRRGPVEGKNWACPAKGKGEGGAADGAAAALSGVVDCCGEAAPGWEEGGVGELAVGGIAADAGGYHAHGDTP